MRVNCRFQLEVILLSFELECSTWGCCWQKEGRDKWTTGLHTTNRRRSHAWKASLQETQIMSFSHSWHTDLKCKNAYVDFHKFWLKTTHERFCFLQYQTCQREAEGGGELYLSENKSLIKEPAVSFSAGFLFNGMWNTEMDPPASLSVTVLHIYSDVHKVCHVIPAKTKEENAND